MTIANNPEMPPAVEDRVHQRWRTLSNRPDIAQLIDDERVRHERHICALQLDFIERCVRLWSNPGETVLSPFAGIGSELYQAVKFGRYGLGIELKESYWRTAVDNLTGLENQMGAATLFDEVDA